MFLVWGSNFIQFYNDACCTILGASINKIGRPAKESLAEIWTVIDPVFQQVMKGQAATIRNVILPVKRDGYIQECYFDFYCSPIKLDYNSVGGVLATVIETTEKGRLIKELDDTKKELGVVLDIKEKEQYRFKQFLMQAPSGICILDGPDHIFELVNPSYQQFFPGRDLLRKPVLEALPELKYQAIPHILNDVYRTGNSFEGKELLVPLAYDNHGPVVNRYFNFIYQARLNAAQKIDGIFVFVHEVTEQVVAKQAIEESQKRFKIMIHQMPVPLLVNKGENLVIDEINQAMIDLIGKGADVKGKPALEVLPELEGQPILERLYHTYRSGEAWNGYEIPIVLAVDGNTEQRFYNLSYAPLIEEGKITGVIQSGVDVTEIVRARKELEQAKDTLNLTITAAELGMFDLDLVSGNLFWDKRCRELFGITHDEPVTYEHDFVMGLHPDDRQRILDVIEKVFIRAVTNGDYDVEYRTIGADDQKLRWVRAKGKTYFDEHDKPVRFLGAVLDITEQKQDELRKNDFIGMVSHELKTPLTSLSAFVQMLQVRAIKEEDKFGVEALSKVTKQVKKMSAMINGFLNVSRLESGKIHLLKQSFDLSQLVNDMIDEVRLTTNTHNIALKPCTPLTLMADQEKIGSVITNLLTNAVKYSPKGTTVTVQCAIINNEARVSVADQGIGINPADIDRLFERFYRIESKQTLTVSGFGIGLYLCAEIIRHHHGEIGVESEPGRGSTFWFTLPLE